MEQHNPPARNGTSALRHYMMPGLAAGHATFHWIIQSFALALPEIQAAFGFNSVEVAGIMSARDPAARLIASPLA